MIDLSKRPLKRIQYISAAAGMTRRSNKHFMLLFLNWDILYGNVITINKINGIEKWFFYCSKHQAKKRKEKKHVYAYSRGNSLGKAEVNWPRENNLDIAECPCGKASFTIAEIVMPRAHKAIVKAQFGQMLGTRAELFVPKAKRPNGKSRSVWANDTVYT
mgnify:CR=1 FL=1